MEIAILYCNENIWHFFLIKDKSLIIPKRYLYLNPNLVLTTKLMLSIIFWKLMEDFFHANF